MWQNLLVELIGSFVGAGLGIWIAFRYDRYRARKDTADRRRLAVTTLIEEITRTLDAVGAEGFTATEARADEPIVVDFSYPYLLDAAFTASVYSGNLALLPAELQTDLSAYYRQLELANVLVKQMVILTPDLDHSNLPRYRNLVTHLSASTAMLQQLGSDILTRLEPLKYP